MKKLLFTTAALAALTLSTPSHAGSFDGPYLGLQVGHNNTKMDTQFIDPFGAGSSFGMSNAASGLEVGVLGGYRMKKDRFVFGIEADATLSGAEETIISLDTGAGDTARIEVEKRHSYAIGPRVGYLVTDNSLAFVGIDWTRGSFKSSATVNGVTKTESGSDNGYRVGAGLEVAASKEISVRLDYQHTNWGKDSDADGSAEMTEDTARIGAIYSF